LQRDHYLGEIGLFTHTQPPSTYDIASSSCLRNVELSVLLRHWFHITQRSHSQISSFLTSLCFGWFYPYMCSALSKPRSPSQILMSGAFYSIPQLISQPFSSHISKPLYTRSRSSGASIRDEHRKNTTVPDLFQTRFLVRRTITPETSSIPTPFPIPPHVPTLNAHLPPSPLPSPKTSAPSPPTPSP
jgi:hypothetical protein